MSETQMRKAGDKVSIKVAGADLITYEEGDILSLDEKGVWLDNGPGNDPSGPYDPETGRNLGYQFGLTVSLVFDGGVAAQQYEEKK